jgi:hypothetical protein
MGELLNGRRLPVFRIKPFGLQSTEEALAGRVVRRTGEQPLRDIDRDSSASALRAKPSRPSIVSPRSECTTGRLLLFSIVSMAASSIVFTSYASGAYERPNDHLAHQSSRSQATDTPCLPMWNVRSAAGTRPDTELVNTMLERGH